MNKLRKWLFKFCFGCELVNYLDVLKEWGENIRAHRENLEQSIQIIESSERVNKLAIEIGDQCEQLLKRCKELEGK